MGIDKIILLQSDMEGIDLNNDGIAELEGSILIPALCIILAIAIICGIAAAARKHREM